MRERTLKGERIEEIRELAEFISEEAPRDGNKVLPDKLLESQGVVVCYGDFAYSFDGLLEYRDGNFFVYCNLLGETDRNSGRSRFTIGHETGHYFLDEHRNSLISGSAPSHASWCGFKSDNWAEREADLFSAHLLMPTKRFIKAARRVTAGLEGIYPLTEEFGSSLTATAIRYVDVMLDRSFLIKWSTEGKVQWTRYSDDWDFPLRRRTLTDSTELLSGSATESIITNGTGKVIVRGTTASAWQRGVRPGWRGDMLLVEEAISLGQFGYLTLLHPDT